jgi:hypothetical protein
MSLNEKGQEFTDPSTVSEIAGKIAGFGAIYQREDSGNFFAGHDHRDVGVLVGTHVIDAAPHRVVDDSLVEEHYGIHRLVLGGGGDMSMYRQVGQE